MANGISKNPLTDISKVYLNQIAEGSLKSLEKASVLAMSDDPKDQEKAREIKTRFDYQSMLKQKKAKKVKEDVSNWRHDLREIIVTADKDAEEPEIKEKKVKNKITINPEFKEAVEELGGELLEVDEVDPKKVEQMKRKEKMLKKRMLRMKLRAVQQTGGEDIVAGHEPEGEIIESRLKKVDECWKTHKQQGYKKKGGRMVPNCVPKNEEVQLEARYERGASDYGKMSIRNKRAVGYGGNAAPPEERRKAHAVRMKKHMTNKGKRAIDPKKNPMSEAYGGKGVSRKAKLASTHPPTAQAAVKNIPTETDRGAGNKAMRRAGKTVEKKSPTYKAYVANKMDEATRYSKETGKSFKSGKPVTKGGTAKDDKAFQFVAKKYAGQMMGGQQKKKVRGQKPDESNTPFKRAAARIKQTKIDNKALADKAKKAGYKSTQDYVNVQAVRKGGLGT